MKSTYHSALDDCLRLVKESNPGVSFAAVLIGSVARNCSTDRSDIDVLLISKETLVRPRCAFQMHVQAFTLAMFIRKLREGDDFVAWCVRLGVPLFHSEIWEEIQSKDDAHIWPDWKPKIQHAVRRLILAWDLFLVGDLSAASEELLYAASHTGRAILLKSKVFPLSRPEMVGQLSECDEPVLSHMMVRLLRQDEERRFLYRTIPYLKRRLIALDRDSYGAYEKKHAQARVERSQARKKSTRVFDADTASQVDSCN